MLHSEQPRVKVTEASVLKTSAAVLDVLNINTLFFFLREPIKEKFNEFAEIIPTVNTLYMKRTLLLSLYTIGRYRVGN